MANGRRPIQKVYRAFKKAGREKEAGTVKEAFLGQLCAFNVDVAKMSSYQLSRVLQGKLTLEELRELSLIISRR